jgi:hypothetical protein
MKGTEGKKKKTNKKTFTNVGTKILKKILSK